MFRADEGAAAERTGIVRKAEDLSVPVEEGAAAEHASLRDGPREQRSQRRVVTNERVEGAAGPNAPHAQRSCGSDDVTPQASGARPVGASEGSLPGRLALPPRPTGDSSGRKGRATFGRPAVVVSL